MPTVKRIEVYGGGSKLNGLKEKQKIRNNNIVTCEWDPTKDVILILETTRGVATHKVWAEPAGFNKDLPIGTIISSYLDWSQFQDATTNNQNNPNGTTWTAKYSKWAPCDGRDVKDSKLAPYQPKVPDLRGVFLRGLNVMDPFEKTHVSPVSNDRKNDDEPSFGVLQSDQFQNHEHYYTKFTHTNVAIGQGQYPDGLTSNPDGDKSIPSSIVEGPKHGSETRPKNLSVFYYIRIN